METCFHSLLSFLAFPLIRRDTPHHLKNKRVNQSVDKERVATIIAQVCVPSSILIMTNLSRPCRSR